MEITDLIKDPVYVEGNRIISNMTLKLKTAYINDYLDITPQMKELITENGVKNGHVIVQSTNTTAGLIANEPEPGFLKDFFAMLERLAPKTNSHEHDAYDRLQKLPNERVNGHSHLKRQLTEISITIIIKNGEMRLGHWLGIVFAELDGARDDREVEIQVDGIK